MTSFDNNLRFCLTFTRILYMLRVHFEKNALVGVDQ